MDDNNSTEEIDIVNFEYERAATARWQAGRKERGLGPDDPFEGKAPLKEASEEALDFGLYLKVAFDRGDIPPDAYRKGAMDIMDLWVMTQTFGGGD